MNQSALETLAGRMRGEVIRPQDAGYEEARRLWNGMVDVRPAVILRCSGVADVMAAVAFVRDQGLGASVRAGGHGVAGAAMCEDGVVIDVSSMRGVSVDPERRVARVSAGARLGDLDHEAQAFGLATTAGVDSRTGVAGLTLGGGQGFLARRLGLTIDNLRAVELVAPDGRFLRATEQQHPDLLWAARGGRGIGVVTGFELQLHPVGPEVLVAQAFHPVEKMREVLRFYRTLMQEAPDELYCYAMVLRVPPAPEIAVAHHGRVSIALVACHSGDAATGQSWVDRIAAFGEPLAAAALPMPYAALQSSFDAGTPEGARYYWKAHYLDTLSEPAIELLAQHGPALPAPYSIIGIEPMGGAVARVPVTATAFPHRQAQYTLGIWSGWDDPAADADAIAWTRSLHDALTPHATGGVYSNYLDQDDGGRSGAAYGVNAERLDEIRRRYDPAGLFRRV